MIARNVTVTKKKKKNLCSVKKEIPKFDLKIVIQRYGMTFKK